MAITNVHRLWSQVLMTAAVLSAPAAAAAQEADVVRAADDAFGRRVGVEQVGLYSESDVRGFNLEDAGNYRIDDAYFVRTAAPANAVVGGTATRVGVNALRYDFPAPSGVVEYELRRGPEGTRLIVDAGSRANSGPFAEFFLDHAPSRGGLSLSAGLQLYPRQRYADGARGDFFSAGAVPRWSPRDGVTLTGVATWTWWRYDADVGYAVDGPFLPPRIERRIYRGQDWTAVRNRTRVLGAIAEAYLARGWKGRASLFHAGSVDESGDFNLYRVTDRAGSAEALAFLVPRRAADALSGELAVSREWRGDRASHRLLLAIRARDSDADTARGVSVELGRMNVLAPAPILPSPTRPAAPAALLDNVRQWMGGAGYRFSLGDAVEFRADLQKTRYAKSFTSPGAPRTSNTTSPWLYGGSVVLGLTPAVTAFTSYTRGIEESGVAPANAANRNAVLPAVLATQAEAGVKYALTRRLTAIGSLFRIDKPVPGLRADGNFDLVGRARHQGVELSVAGAVDDRLNIVAGVTYLDAKVEEESEATRPATGRPEWLAQVNATWQVPGATGLSLDGAVNYTGVEAVNRAATLRTRPLTVVNAGLRFAFKHDGAPFTLRARVTNLLNAFAWTAAPSEVLFYNAPRSFALSVAAEL